MKFFPHIIVVVAVSLVGCSSSSGFESEASKSSEVRRTDSLAESVKAAAPEVRNEKKFSGLHASESHSMFAPVKANVRKVIHTAQVQVCVQDIEKSERALTKFVLDQGGYVDSSAGNEFGTQAGKIRQTVRIPVNSFDPTLAFIREQGIRISQEVSSQDVTGQIADLGARTATMRAQEASYRTMLSKANSLADHIQLSDRLTSLRAEIEGIEAQQASLIGLSDLSTIAVTWVQNADAAGMQTLDSNWLSQAWGESMLSMKSLVQGIVSSILWFVAISPIWVPLTLLLLYFKSRKKASPRPVP
jgi:hypothetical protein